MHRKCQCHVRPKSRKTHYHSKSYKDGWDSQCKFCSDKHQKRWYKKHHEAALKSGKLRRAAYFREWVKIIEARNMTSCSKCGYNKCFAAIDFHHIDPGTKDFQMGRLLIQKPTEVRIKELEKTIPLCSNCHREIEEQLRAEEKND